MRLGIRLLSPHGYRLLIGLVVWAAVLLPALPAAALSDETETLTITNEGGIEPDQAPPPIITINENLSGRTVAGTITVPDATFTIKLDDIVRPDITVLVGAKAGDTYPWSFIVPEDMSKDQAYHVRVEAMKDGVSAEPKTTMFQLEPTPTGGPEITPVKEDPVLREMSASLSQPFPTPKPFTTMFLPPTDKPLRTINAFTPLPTKLLYQEPMIDQHIEPLAVSASDQGWRILGIAWYWWVLVGLSAMGLWQAVKVLLRRYQRRKAALLLVANAE